MRGGIIKFAATIVCVALATSFAFALGGGQTALRVIQTQTMLIRHKATEEQRRVAENNAKIFFSQLAPEKKQELKRKKVHVVLIRTTRSRETSPAAKEVRMRYSLEGNHSLTITPTSFRLRSRPERLRKPPVSILNTSVSDKLVCGVTVRLPPLILGRARCCPCTI